LSLTFRKQHRLRVFEKRVLRRIFEPRSVPRTGGCRKVHNEELHKLYSSPSILTIIKARNMRCEEHVLRMGRRGIHRGFWWESQTERDY
jgi:hypothetical protein